MERRIDNNRAIWLGAVAGVALVGTLYWFIRHQDVADVMNAPPTSAELPAESAPLPEETPPASYPVPEPAAQAEPLPDLDGSDESFRAAIAGAVGQAPVEAFLLPSKVIQRFVIFVDNLDRAALPLRFWPIAHTKGPFGVDAANDAMTVSAKNAARYEPFLAAFESADPKKVVAVYYRYYPLFQEAYRQVGYPDRQFNDRLIAIIDHLLEAPTITEPVALVRPKVLYQFADPEIEKLSWGQKTMIRIGPANEARVKAKLEGYRAALTVVTAPKP
ncbi:MAG TPA: DUF3014 domain-containing protein [Nevskiaceae bacterium]|nr:DUF3014 domain-containing protein [Nevskiaceae bacterium]